MRLFFLEDGERRSGNRGGKGGNDHYRLVRMRAESMAYAAPAGAVCFCLDYEGLWRGGGGAGGKGTKKGRETFISGYYSMIRYTPKRESDERVRAFFEKTNPKTIIVVTIVVTVVVVVVVALHAHTEAFFNI